jgi:polar amino acid transport system ATP-binding protein
MPGPVIRFVKVVKNYGGLRPLRLADLTVDSSERIVLGGIDALAAEAFVNLVTGAALPDEGVVEVAGTPTAAIADGDAWLASLDRFGIVSDRAVLLEGSTFLQNLALPLTLEIDAIQPEIKRRVETLAAEAGLPVERLPAQIATATPEERMRAQLARALALDPAILLLEHPSAKLPREAAAPFGRDLAAIIVRRRITALAISEDADFAKPFASRWLKVDGATGAVNPAKRKWLF